MNDFFDNLGAGILGLALAVVFLIAVCAVLFAGLLLEFGIQQG